MPKTIKAHSLDDNIPGIRYISRRQLNGRYIGEGGGTLSRVTCPVLIDAAEDDVLFYPVYLFIYFHSSSGGWEKKKLKLPHFHQLARGLCSRHTRFMSETHAVYVRDTRGLWSRHTRFTVETVINY